MLFDTAVRRELAKSFGATLVVLLTIVLTLGLVRTVGAAAQGRISAQDVLLLLGYTGIAQVAPLLALSMFIATVHTLGRLWRDSEMVIWNTAGLSLSRFVRPVLRMAWLVCVSVALLVFFATPWVNRQAADLTQRYLQRSDLSRVSPGVFQSSSDGRSVFFIERERGDETSARSVFIHTQASDRESLTTARSGRIETREDGTYLVLDQGHRIDRIAATAESFQGTFQTAAVRLGNRPANAKPDTSPRVIDTWTLITARTPEGDGEPAWRFGLTLACFNLLILGIGLSVSNPRKPSNWGILFALLTFVLYFNLINLSQSWVYNRQAPLGAALVLLHGSVALLGWAVLAWRDQAWGWRLLGLGRFLQRSRDETPARP